MSRSHIAKALREQIVTEARHRCGYCLTSARIIGAPMEIDHIIPESLGGPTVRENLWLACSMCNDHKANRIAALDPLTEEDWTIVRQLIARHILFTNSAFAKRIQATLADQPFVKVMPRDFKRVQKAEAKARAENREPEFSELVGSV